MTGRHSVERIEIKTIKLYESGTYEVKVCNPYPHDVEFLITLDNLTAMTDIGAKFKRSHKNEGKGVEEILKDMGKMGSNIPAFFLLQEKIRIKKRAFTKLKLLYLPVTFEVHRCHIVFCDENVGELQYEIIGIPQYPLPIDTIKINTYIDSTNPLPIPIGMNNVQTQQAYFKLMELSKGVKDDGAKETLMKFINTVKTEDTFHLEVTPAAGIMFPPTFTIFDENAENMSEDGSPQNAKEKKKAEEISKRKNIPTDELNVLKLALNFRNPVKEYTATVIMKNEAKTDLRLYDLNITILPKVFKATIQMKTPARMPLEQTIPVSNPMEKESKIKINFVTTKGEQSFSCPTTLNIKPHQTGYLPIKFNPVWKGEFVAKVT